MKSISLDITKAAQFLQSGAIQAYESKVKAAQEALENGTCPGNDFLGWLHLPSSITPEFLNEVQCVADTLREKCEVIVVAGIGGSYLGARAVIEALGNAFAWLVDDKQNPTILFAGNNIGEDYLSELTEYLRDKRFGVINISKSGTTTETALTFRLLKKQCELQRGKQQAKDVIVAITDAKKGAARTQRGLQEFHHSRQRGWPFLGTYSRGFAAHCVCRLRHQSTCRRCCRYGKSNRKGSPFRAKHRCPVCCCA